MKELQDFLEIAQEISGLEKGDILVDVHLDDCGLSQDEFYISFVRTAERNGQKPENILPPQFENDEIPTVSVVNGLRDLAVFSGRSRARLADLSRLRMTDTITSTVLSIKAGTYVPSALEPEPLRPTGGVELLFRYLIPFSVAVAVPAYYSHRSCTPLCEGYFDPSAMDQPPYYLIGAGLFVIYLGFKLVPAIGDLFRSRD